MLFWSAALPALTASVVQKSILAEPLSCPLSVPLFRKCLTPNWMQVTIMYFRWPPLRKQATFHNSSREAGLQKPHPLVQQHHSILRQNILGGPPFASRRSMHRLGNKPVKEVKNRHARLHNFFPKLQKTCRFQQQHVHSVSWQGWIVACC